MLGVSGQQTGLGSRVNIWIFFVAGSNNNQVVPAGV